MWYLTNSKTQHVYYLVSQPAGHTVGRTGTDLIITGDESISRNHAMLQPYKNVLNLTDTGSRYGSYVNDNIAKTVPISKEQATALKPGDKIRFGRCGSIWLVGKVDFQCLTSTLIMDDELKTILHKIGAELVSKYTEEVTHLIMPTITITTKFLQCLVGQVPIVKPELFQTIDRDCIAHGKALPSEKDFVPVCTEPYMRNEPQLFHPNATRSDLFKGKEFIFFNTVQFRQFENIVKIAGGVCLCAKSEKIVKSRFLKPNVVAIRLNSSSTTQSQSQSFETMSQYLASYGRRMVPDMEIGLALIFCSTEKYCNSEYNFAFNVEECCSSVGGDGDTLAKSTEQQTESMDGKRTNMAEIHTIPETELHTEVKQQNASVNSKTTISSSSRSTSSFVIPKAESFNKNIPEERRKSKRINEEALTVKEHLTDRDDYNIPKRRRRNASPVKSVSYSPVVDSKLTETERQSSELHVPETQPTTDSAVSHALQASGFRAVKRNLMERSVRTGIEPAKAQRSANLDLDDDDMLMFNELAPRKKRHMETNKEKTPTTNTVASRNSKNTPVAEENTVASRNSRNTPVAEESLFCFDDLLTTQKRRAANQRKAKQSASIDVVPPNNLSKTSIVSSDASLSRSVGIQNRNASDDSMRKSYREFIKPIHQSSIGWLASTMDGLEISDPSFDETKIKSEPLDEIDDPYGIQRDSKKWIKSVENAISVLDVSLKLVARRPIDVTGQEVSCVTSDGGKNFKAFVKKRNYPSQLHVSAVKLVCVLDDTQCG
ncbi:nibrin [Anopheles moucheti]|uniref:nibrin n=1 Tax=Anopheles moucheti TaxID=186751 RepID=UPI0022F12291|nr:nibrin [Anopheles moucheti]